MLMQLSIELVFIILVKPLWTAVHVVTNRPESVGRETKINNRKNENLLLCEKYSESLWN